MVRGGGVSTRIVEKNLKHILTLINNFEAILPLRFISATNSFFKIKFYWKIQNWQMFLLLYINKFLASYD